jgi:DNA polymerase-3 subunit alpha
LKRGGNGIVSFVVIRDAGAREYEIELPGKYALSAEVAGGIKALEGITDVRFN